MIEPVFRSRGIRILCNNGKLSLQEKLYYEPDERCKIENEYLENLQSRGLISLFEYSTVNDIIDTYNFHVNLNDNDFFKIYENLSSEILREFDYVRECFGSSFRNFTVGYRFEGSRIINESYYFYPTVWNKSRYRIKEITDKDKMEHGIEVFLKKIPLENTSSREIIHDFTSILYKLKGLSIHVSDHIIGYKVYGCVEAQKLNSFIWEKSKYDISENSKYGDVILVALRIINDRIEGCNIYYPS